MDKVLIVDNDAIGLENLRKELGKFVGQFEVLTAADGAAALAVLNRERISVLVMDLDMPSTNGSDLLAHMRQHRPQVPCIVMAERQQAGSLDPTVRDHILGCLAKPFEIKELFTLVMEGLERIDEGTFWREHRRG